MATKFDWYAEAFDRGIQGLTRNTYNLNASLLEMAAEVMKLNDFTLKFPVGFQTSHMETVRVQWPRINVNFLLAGLQGKRIADSSSMWTYFE